MQPCLGAAYLKNPKGWDRLEESKKIGFFYAYWALAPMGLKPLSPIPLTNKDLQGEAQVTSQIHEALLRKIKEEWAQAHYTEVKPKLSFSGLLHAFVFY